MKKAEDAIPNELLSFEREQRLWTQEEVAEHIGAPDANMVGRWERGITRPTSYYRQQLLTLFGKSTRELGFVRKGEIPFWHVPYRQNAYFTGRDELLRQIHTHFKQQQRTRPLPPLALSGLGGVGKTQTALEYAYRYRHEYHTVVWVRAESSEALISDFIAFAGLLNIPDCQQQDHQSTINAVKYWLSAMTRWLFIFDNVDDLAMLNDFLPSAPRGHLLLTTRMQTTGTAAETLAIESMNPMEGAYFLLRRSKIVGFNAAFDDIGKDDHHLAVSISEKLGGLPLALDQAGAYIEETACGLDGYLERYQQLREAFLQRRGHADLHHPEPVATTWSLAFEKASQSNIDSIALLRFLAFFSPDAIPL
ncbi:MAG TPA: NB-ARC domain-containing protein [Ktedonobacteraceae bacterium]|nr:NB-ARC domain-containing protein [Ktedonobacteraceae bacterium]